MTSGKATFGAVSQYEDDTLAHEIRCYDMLLGLSQEHSAQPLLGQTARQTDIVGQTNIVAWGQYSCGVEATHD